MSFRFMTGLILPILVCSQCYSQEVHFSQKRASLKVALRSIEEQAHIGNIFTSGNDCLDSLVTLPLAPTPLLTVLSDILGPLSLAFTIDQKTIVIHKEVSLSPHPVQETVPSLTVTGSVVDENGNPLTGASIQLKDSVLKGTQSDDQGEFRLKKVSKGAVLVVSYNGMETAERAVTGTAPVSVQLKATSMKMVVVQPTNGYQHYSRENVTASFDVIGPKQIDLHVVTDVRSLIENSGSGILYLGAGRAASGGSLRDHIQIRGRSTFLADSDPLIVLDNLPYDGDLNNISPSEIESITILKDAAAASIWGARAGNGVIVIVTKKDRVGAPQLIYHSAIGVQPRPDFSNIHAISSGDFLDFEQQLYGLGYYTATLADSQNYNPVTPGVLLLQQGNDAQRTALRKLNMYNDISKYLYRTSVNQQHSLQLSGGSGLSRYYFSAGYDHNLSTVSGTQYNRLTLRSQNHFQVTRNLQLEAGINFAETDNKNGGNIQYDYHSPLRDNSIYPYAQLKSGQGQVLPLYLDYNSTYLQQTHAAGFPDWTFKPLNELAAETNKVRTRDYLLTTAIRYKLFAPLTLEVRYQFEDQLISGKDLHSDSSYFTRDLRNSFIQVDALTHALSYPVPSGGILDMTEQEVVSHQGRITLNFNQEWKETHGLQAMLGYEIRSLETTGNTNRYYGYDPGRSLVNPVIDYIGSYPQYLTYTTRTITNPQAITQLADHFISYFANATYSYRHRYHLYGSIRDDQANLFGVATNEKGVPLWSGGMSWQAEQEQWYPLKDVFPMLKFRVTYGQGGNIARLASAYTTAAAFPGGVSGSPYSMLVIQSPPNKNLRWERVGQLNFGVDFSTCQSIVTGTVEYYQKYSRDLLAQTTADPTLGLAQSPGTPGSYYANTGAMNGNGIDLQLEIHSFNHGSFRWTTNLYASYSAAKVKQYLNPVGLGSLYLNQNAITPVKGRPLFSVYSFKAAGLDPSTGAFQGIYQGKSSMEYNSIYNNTSLDGMKYSGPAQPVYFGSMRNSFSLGDWSLSFLLSFQAGHYYRQPGTSQSDLAINWRGYSDYAHRWQQSGDEKYKDVPAFHYPIDEVQDKVYTYSSSLIKKSDEIRCDELTISYDLDKKKQHRLPFGHLRFLGNITGLGVLWTANKDHIDPYFIDMPKDRPRYSLGITLTFLSFQSAK